MKLYFWVTEKEIQFNVCNILGADLHYRSVLQTGPTRRVRQQTNLLSVLCDSMRYSMVLPVYPLT